MGIRPLGNGPKPTYGQDDTNSRYGDWVSDLENAGETSGEVLAEIDAKSSSSNQSTQDLATAIRDLESQPILLWWDGNGTKPRLKPGWGLFNTSTGKMEE